MSIVLVMLKILLYVLLGVLCLLVVLLLIPVTATIHFRQGVLSLVVRYLFIKYQVLPSRKKGDLEEKNATDDSAGQLNAETQQSVANSGETASCSSNVPEENPKVSDTSEVSLDDFPADALGADKGHTEADPDGQNDVADGEKSSLADLWHRIRPFLDPAKKAVIALCHRIHIREIEIIYNVRGSDAARVGMLSGAAWAVIGEMMRFLHVVFGKNVEYKEITVYPCFDPDDGADERFGCEITVTPIIIVLIAICFGFRYLKEKLTSKE